MVIKESLGAHGHWRRGGCCRDKLEKALGLKKGRDVFSGRYSSGALQFN